MNTAGWRRITAGLSPAGATALFALAVLWLRPPLPVDETRYLEVFHESLRGSPLLLRLLGQPYAEKPPLLFWLGRLLAACGLGADVALRCLPALALGGTVLYVQRLGARLGLVLAGWTQATLWIGLLSAQFLHFDPLLTLCVAAALDAWVRRAPLALWSWSAAALLAKGPVALLHLVPMLWALAPLRGPRAGNRGRTALVLLLSLVPVAAWALAAAREGGEEFARALLWDRWAGRVVKSADHARAWYFYLPVVLVGSLPASFLLFRREGGCAAGTSVLVRSRLGWTLAGVLVLFTLISGKQAHYLEPAVPGFAIWVSLRLETEEDALAALQHGVMAQGLLSLAAAGAGFLLLPRAQGFGPHGQNLLATRGFMLPLVLMASSALAASLFAWRGRLGAPALLGASLLASAGLWLPLNWLAGELLFPHDLARVLRAGSEPVAYLGSARHGLYAWLARERMPQKIVDPARLADWTAEHPRGLVIAEPEGLDASLAEQHKTVTVDVVHGTPIVVLRRR